MQEEAFKIRPGWSVDWQPAMELAWRTFLKFEAGDYPEEGIDDPLPVELRDNLEKVYEEANLLID